MPRPPVIIVPGQGSMGSRMKETNIDLGLGKLLEIFEYYKRQSADIDAAKQMAGVLGLGADQQGAPIAEGAPGYTTKERPGMGMDINKLASGPLGQQAIQKAFEAKFGPLTWDKLMTQLYAQGRTQEAQKGWEMKTPLGTDKGIMKLFGQGKTEEAKELSMIKKGTAEGMKAPEGGLRLKNMEGNLKSFAASVAPTLGFDIQTPEGEKQFFQYIGSPNGQTQWNAYLRKIYGAQGTKYEGLLKSRVVPIYDWEFGVGYPLSADEAIKANKDAISRGEMPPYLAIPSSERAVKARTLLNEMSNSTDPNIPPGSSQILRGSIYELDRDFDEDQRAALYAVLTSPALDNPNTAKGLAHQMMDNLVRGQFGKTLTEKQTSYVVNLQNLLESAMALRPAMSLGGAGSDTLREAMARMIPSAGTFSKDMAIKQLDAFDLQVERLRPMIFKVPLPGSKRGAPLPGEGGGGTTIRYDAQGNRLP